MYYRNVMCLCVCVCLRYSEDVTQKFNSVEDFSRKYYTQELRRNHVIVILLLLIATQYVLWNMQRSRHHKFFQNLLLYFKRQLCSDIIFQWTYFRLKIYVRITGFLIRKCFIEFDIGGQVFFSMIKIIIKIAPCSGGFLHKLILA